MRLRRRGWWGTGSPGTGWSRAKTCSQLSPCQMAYTGRRLWYPINHSSRWYSRIKGWSLSLKSKVILSSWRMYYVFCRISIRRLSSDGQLNQLYKAQVSSYLRYLYLTRIQTSQTVKSHSTGLVMTHQKILFECTHSRLPALQRLHATSWSNKLSKKQRSKGN